MNTNEKFCRYCGKKIIVDSEFCSYCGKSLKEDNAVEETKITNSIKRNNPFKVLFSWIVMVVIFIVAILLFALVIGLGRIIMNEISTWPVLIRIAIFIFGGLSYLFGLLIAPLFYGVPALIAISERVCPSKKGTRYVVFGIIITILYLGEFFIRLLKYSSFEFDVLLIVVFGIALAYIGSHTNKI